MATATLLRSLRCPQTGERLRYNLLAIRADGALFNAMVGMGENYFAAFALAMGLGQTVSGLVTTVPLFLGALLQLASPWGVRLFRSHRGWVVFAATCQAAAFFPLFMAAKTGQLTAARLFAVVAVYWGAGLATMPAWNTWVGQIVPVRFRAHFFSRRARISQGALLCGFLTAGITLQIAAGRDFTLGAFACLFTLAGICRLLSAGFLASQSEPAPTLGRQLTAVEIMARFRHSNEGRLLLYLIALQAAVQISGPYFTPFMLKQMRLSYATYAMLIGVSFVAKVVAAPWWGIIARRCGARALMWFGGAGIIPIAGLWLVSQSVPYLILLQVVSGVFWAAYELAMFLLLFDSIAEEERVSVLTAYNFVNATAMCIGSLVGAGILALGNQSYTAYLIVFGISSACRLAALPLLIRVQPAPRLTPALGRRLLANPAFAVRRFDEPHPPVPAAHVGAPQTEPAELATAT